MRADLQAHISAILLRVNYQIGSHNPLANHKNGITRGLAQIELDFVISTVKVSEKNAPVVQAAPFTTPTSWSSSAS
ncbi:hypothetical protein WP7W18E02_04500 [Aeromonas media]|nr:hypothetical protein WP7W18E02_04500 [Aeromonas media]